MVADEKLFGCPYCGFRIDPGDESCARCGNKFESGTMFECPFCGDLVGPGMESCPSCHINFAEFQTRVKKSAKKDSIDTLLMDIIKLEANEMKSAAKKFSCPNCDLMLNGSEAKCPRCKADLTEGSAFQCPVCGEFVDPEADKCSECGASFEGEEEEKAEADHEAVSTALDDLLTSAGRPGPLPEVEPKPEIVETLPEPEPVRQETRAEPILEPEYSPEPVPEPVLEPEPIPEPVVAPVEEPIPEPIQETESVLQSASASAAPKKPRQRKLKAKPSGTTARGQQ